MSETTLPKQKEIFRHLDDVINRDRLFYPREVVAELEQAGSVKRGRPFPPYHWAKRNQKLASIDGSMFEELKSVLAHPQVSRVFEPEKVSGPEQADPHVLALAVFLRNNGYDNVAVITEDRKDTPLKLSLQSACGILNFSTIPVRPFLVELGLLPVKPPRA